MNRLLYCCLFIYLLFGCDVLSAQPADCLTYFKSVYNKMKNVEVKEGGKAYKMRCRFIVLAPDAQKGEATTQTVEMVSDGRVHHYESDAIALFGDKRTAVYIDKVKKRIMITEGVSTNMIQRKMNFSTMVHDSIFSHARLVQCRPIHLQGSSRYLKMEFVVDPAYQQVYNMRRIEYYIDEAREQVFQVQLVYYNRPDLNRMLVIFDEAAYVDGPPIAGKVLDELYEKKKIKQKYADYQLIDKRN